MKEVNEILLEDYNFIRTSNNNRDFFYCDVSKYKIIDNHKIYIYSELYEINKIMYEDKVFNKDESCLIKKHESDLGLYHGFVCSVKKVTFGNDPIYDLFPLSGSREDIILDGTFQIGTYCKIRLNGKDFKFVK